MQKILETTAWLKEHTSIRPELAIVLGSGLGDLANEIEVTEAFSYEEIPNFPVSTVEGHQGRLLFGYLCGKSVMAMKGRFHYYEGYSMKEVTFPERVMHQMGVTTLILSNAAGGLNPAFKVGDVMLISDHINFMPEHPLRGQNLPVGPRFPDMHDVYDKAIIQLAETVAAEQGLKLQKGVYLGVSGPTFETPAECRAFRTMGTDAVGMSTVPEAIVAHHQGMRCFGLSIITDLEVEGVTDIVSHEEVQKAANSVREPLARLIKEVVRRLQ